MRYISNFEAAVAFEAVRLGVDGVICGHIHRPQIVPLNDITYCNCGDWVESNSALVEHGDGRLELLHWQDTHRIAHGNQETAYEPIPLISHHGGTHHQNGAAGGPAGPGCTTSTITGPWISAVPTVVSRKFLR